MTSTCPAGHTSEADDYCDVCGAPMGASAGGGPAADAAAAAVGAPSGAGPAGAGGAAGSGAPGPRSPLDLGPAGAGGDRTCPHCGAANVPGALFCEDCGYDFTTGQLPRTDPPPLTPPPGVTAPGGAAPPGTPTDSAPSGTPTAAGPDTAPDTGAVTPPPLPDAAVPPLTPPTGAGAAAGVAAAADAAVPPGLQGPVEWVVEVWVDPDWHAAQEVSEPCPSPGMPQVVPLRGTSQLVGRRSVSRNIHPQIDCGADTGVSRRHAQLTTDGQRWWVEDLQSSNGTYVGTAGGGLPDDPVAPGQRAELPDDARVYVGAWTRLVVRPATMQEREAAG